MYYFLLVYKAHYFSWVLNRTSLFRRLSSYFRNSRASSSWCRKCMFPERAVCIRHDYKKKKTKPNKNNIVSLLDSWFSASPRDFPQVKQLLSILKWSGVHLTFAVTCYSVHTGNLTHEVMFFSQLLYPGCLQKFYSPSLLLTDTVLHELPHTEEMLSEYNLLYP